ncbi:DUF4232 domain-containing protein [Streptomyces sp. NRRL F-5123]|uniref:DUF4232 domain-containing protein n=1 Tax=Streptomyces sp. NRRL F-5123 TaxID=1463856 RepID=UPI00069336EC|nr:DUF4232 domain-containing protein [Streptomyces sp. NRRL F-5123]
MSLTSFTSLASAAVLGLGVLTLTACQSDDTGAAPSTTSSSPAAPAAGTSGTPTASTAPAAPASASPGEGDGRSSTSKGGGSKTGTPRSGTSKGGGSKGGGDATSDSYAFTHPCTPQQLSVHVTGRSGAPSQRVIAVRNTGQRSCGLSYYPLVHLDNAKAPNGERAVHPMIPSGLGGAPAFPVYAGATAYAVIDLDPSGATTGTVPGIDELNVLPDGDHMPNAATLGFPLPAATPVLHPKLGLYRTTVADAVSSMRSADYQS